MAKSVKSSVLSMSDFKSANKFRRKLLKRLRKHGIAWFEASTAVPLWREIFRSLVSPEPTDGKFSVFHLRDDLQLLIPLGPTDNECPAPAMYTHIRLATDTSAPFLVSGKTVVLTNSATFCLMQLPDLTKAVKKA